MSMARRLLCYQRTKSLGELLDPFILLLGPYKFSVNIISSILVCELLVHAEDFIHVHDCLYLKCTIEGHCFLLLALMKSLKVYRVDIP